ncbi:hypothetical protein [Laribacter hongkongensis]|uniref:hypothetical protein n=1 Tax=Laribacter hongkongensis TaxID=168471 RepID=UPI0012DD70B0|nr:hypothetical protein [Laribacter hongkongensis]
MAPLLSKPVASSVLLDDLESSLIALENLHSAVDMERFSAQLNAFFRAEQVLGSFLENHLLDVLAKHRLQVVVNRFSLLMEAVEVRRDYVGGQLAELTNRDRQVARINRAYRS